MIQFFFNWSDIPYMACGEDRDWATIPDMARRQDRPRMEVKQRASGQQSRVLEASHANFHGQDTGRRGFPQNQI